MSSWRQSSDDPFPSADSDGQCDPLVRRLLIYATIFRGCAAVAMLLRFSLPAMLVWAVLTFDRRANGGFPQEYVIWLIGLSVVLLGIALFIFVQCLRTALNLWGIGRSSFALPIPKRSECVMQLVGVGLVVGLLCLFIWVANWMNPQAQQFMPQEFYLPAAGIGMMIVLLAVAAIAGLRARSILDRIPIVPDVSLIEEPKWSLLPAWLTRRQRQSDTTADHDE